MSDPCEEIKRVRCPVVHGDPEKVGPLACGVCDGRGWLTSDDVRTLIAELDEARRAVEAYAGDLEAAVNDVRSLEARLNEAREALAYLAGTDWWRDEDASEIAARALAAISDNPSEATEGGA